MAINVFISHHQSDMDFTDALEDFLDAEFTDAQMICIMDNMTAFSFTAEDGVDFKSAFDGFLEAGQYEYDSMVFVRGEVV